jgi:hypothetical protein
MRHTILPLLFLPFMILILNMVIFAQYPNIQVNSPSGGFPPEEVTIAINPVNPLNLAAGANIDYYYYSMDGGYTWSQGRLTNPLGVYGDPSVTFDASGNLYYAHLSNPATGGYWLDRIVVQKSTDGGMSWDAGAGAGLNPPRQQDKEWITSDRTGSPYRNSLSMTWTEFDDYGSNNPADSSRILFSRSADSGASWLPTVRVSDRGGNCLDGDSTVEGAVPTVGPQGEIYVSWAGPEGILFDKSLDGGSTFGRDIFVTSQPGGWDFSVDGIYRCNGLPVTACDISNSPFRGNIYVLWSDQRNGTDNTDVFIIKSTDGGESWGATVRVNNDTTRTQQFFPWMAIDDSTGFIYVVFYDRRSTFGDATDVFMAKSTDGGETFTNFKISNSSFTPTSSIFFGDYINIAALNRKIYPIWMRMDQTTLSVWMAIINDSVTTGIPLPVAAVNSDLTLYQNFPNPFNPVTTITFTLARSGPATLRIYNTLGEEVATLISGHLSAGTHTCKWDASAAANGIYIYTLEVGKFTESRKMVVIR